MSSKPRNRDNGCPAGVHRPTAAAWGLGLLLLAAPLQGQVQLFPDQGPFQRPLAAPRAGAVVGRVLSIRQGDSRFGDEVEGEAVLGEDIALFAVGDGPRPVIFGFGAEVYGRFSLSDPKSALISTDWVVGVDALVPAGAWELALQLQHESSHLGDEYADRFGVARLDWTREFATGWAAWRRGAWRAAGSLTYVLADGLDLPPLAGAVALDFDQGPAGRPVRPIAGLFVSAEEATAWRMAFAARAGVAFAGRRAGREFALSLVAYDGPSTQRQFFQADTRYVGAEIRFEL